MRNEAELNNIIRKSFIASGGWAYKIPDPGGLSALNASARAFDGFGVFEGRPLYWESKFSKKLESFNLKLIEDHQIENLLRLQHLIPNSLCIIFYGVKVARGDNRIFVFPNVEIIQSRRLKKQNFLKKELETLPYYRVRNNLCKFDFSTTN